MIIYTLTKAGLTLNLKNRGATDDGMYFFADSKEKSREETLIVWDKTTSARTALICLSSLLPTNVNILVNMAEEYARERNDREETTVCRCIIQLLIARATELYQIENPDETLIIEGNFSLIGQLPPNGKLRINGKVERIEGSTGNNLEVKCEECPNMEFRGMATQKKDVWQIVRTTRNCVFPLG